MVLQTFVCRGMLGSTDPSQEKMRRKRASRIGHIPPKLFLELITSYRGDDVNMNVFVLGLSNRE